MGPEACLKRGAIALENDNFAEACWALLDYWNWRRQGDFAPFHGDAIAHRLLERLAQALERREGEQHECL